MNILFLSLTEFDSFEDRDIYTDLLREFLRQGHSVSCIAPVERRRSQPTRLLEFGGGRILKLRIGNTQKVGLIEKGISTLLIEPLFIQGIRRYFSDVRFDLVLYTTPPVTFARVIRYVKKRDGAKSYLMLKDIFPQNAVDLGMLDKTGVKGLIYRHFRNQEKQLYALSDHIGCMSPANVDYIRSHEPWLEPGRVKLCPNAMEPRDIRVSGEEREAIRRRYGLPMDKKIFVYGGNLGRPQDVPFIVRCMKACAGMEDVFFVVAGSGTDRYCLEEYVRQEEPAHVKLFGFIPKEEYDAMIACCDVGLIFLDYRFTIPNFPSRLLSYLQAGLPVLCATDPNSDVGKVAEDGDFGWRCESSSEENYLSAVSLALKADLPAMGRRGWEYLLREYTAEKNYETIVNHLGEAHE